jgi:hypothetical protein
MKNTQILKMLVILVERYCDIVYHEFGCKKCPCYGGDGCCKIRYPNWDKI